MRLRGFYEAVDIVGPRRMRVFGLSSGKGAEMAERSVTAGRFSVWLLEPAAAEEEAACGAAHRAEPQLPHSRALGPS